MDKSGPGMKPIFNREKAYSIIAERITDHGHRWSPLQGHVSHVVAQDTGLRKEPLRLNVIKFLKFLFFIYIAIFSWDPEDLDVSPGHSV